MDSSSRLLPHFQASAAFRLALGGQHRPRGRTSLPDSGLFLWCCTRCNKRLKRHMIAPYSSVPYGRRHNQPHHVRTIFGLARAAAAIIPTAYMATMASDHKPRHAHLHRKYLHVCHRLKRAYHGRLFAIFTNLPVNEAEFGFQTRRSPCVPGQMGGSLRSRVHYNHVCFP